MVVHENDAEAQALRNRRPTGIYANLCFLLVQFPLSRTMSSAQVIREQEPGIKVIVGTVTFHFFVRACVG